MPDCSRHMGKGAGWCHRGPSRRADRRTRGLLHSGCHRRLRRALAPSAPRLAGQTPAPVPPGWHRGQVEPKGAAASPLHPHSNRRDRSRRDGGRYRPLSGSMRYEPSVNRSRPHSIPARFVVNAPSSGYTSAWEPCSSSAQGSRSTSRPPLQRSRNVVPLKKPPVCHPAWWPHQRPCTLASPRRDTSCRSYEKAPVFHPAWWPDHRPCTVARSAATKQSVSLRITRGTDCFAAARNDSVCLGA